LTPFDLGSKRSILNVISREEIDVLIQVKQRKKERERERETNRETKREKKRDVNLFIYFFF